MTGTLGNVSLLAQGPCLKRQAPRGSVLAAPTIHSPPHRVRAEGHGVTGLCGWWGQHCAAARLVAVLGDESTFTMWAVKLLAGGCVGGVPGPFTAVLGCA